jgi:hypothetical protein
MLSDPRDARGAQASTLLVQYLQDGGFNRTGIPLEKNQAAGLAFNPNRIPPGPGTANADFDCWIVNREQVPLAIDPQPMSGSQFGGFAGAVLGAIIGNGLGPFLQHYLGVSSAMDVVNYDQRVKDFIGKLEQLFNSADPLDMVLDAFLTPLADPGAPPNAAHAIVTGVLDGQMGTGPNQTENHVVGVSAHMAQSPFPGSGIMGTGMEIAMSPADAFCFLQTHVLGPLAAGSAFFGYVSIRLVTQTNTFMGMQQFSPSVMVEVVAFANQSARDFISSLQAAVKAAIAAGKAMIPHWGLENDQFDANTLSSIVANLPTDSPMKLGVAKFQQVRNAVYTAAVAASGVASLFPVFDNDFTHRLGLSP